MIRRLGSWPSTQAGSATDVQIDFKWRGGIVTIKRLVSPLNTLDNSWQTASICQLGEKPQPGLTVPNTFWTKAAKSVRRIELRTPSCEAAGRDVKELPGLIMRLLPTWGSRYSGADSPQ
jgi:hypothetical protein